MTITGIEKLPPEVITIRSPSDDDDLLPRRRLHDDNARRLCGQVAYAGAVATPRLGETPRVGGVDTLAERGIEVQPASASMHRLMDV